MSLIITAQESQSSSPVITVDNIQSLQSVGLLNFATDLTLSEAAFDGQINFGWFVASSQADRFLLIDSENTVLSVMLDGTITAQIADMNLVDAVPMNDDYFALLFATSDGFDVWYDNLNSEIPSTLKVSIVGDATPSAVWVDCMENDNTQLASCAAYVEAFTDTTTTIFMLPPFDTASSNTTEIQLDISDLRQESYLPASNEAAVVRIGRIHLPYVVTSSLDGTVQLWNLADNDLVYDINNGTGEPSVFGNINANATDLVWRDNANQTLYLLNFETGENREIAPLNGEYAQWYFLSDDASLIIAVNLGGEPNVVVWDVATGERTILGNYRDCERPQPDMVRFDGRTLIIGCDTGLDIWQINQG